jgi:hypothetical protein
MENNDEDQAFSAVIIWTALTTESKCPLPRNVVCRNLLLWQWQTMFLSLKQQDKAVLYCRKTESVKFFKP